MNREINDWKCPNCDTVNIGRRCVVCNTEKPIEKVVALEKQEEGLKKSPAVLVKRVLMILGVMIAIMLIIAGIFHKNKEIQREPIKAINTHEVEMKNEKEKEVYVNDYIYRNSFSLTVDKHGMDKHPEFMQKENSEIVYSVPMNFREIEEDSYEAYDETAAIKFFNKRVDGSKTVSDIMKEGKRKFAGNIIDEDSDVNWYIFLAQIDEIQYYYCEKLQNGEVIGFVFSYPEEYLDVYDDYYFAALVEGLKFPLEVVEIN